MRLERELIDEVARHGRLVLDLTDDLDEAAFVRRFGDGINQFGAAISFALVAALAVPPVALAAPSAQTTTPAGSRTDVTGVWVMEVEGHQFGLELEQKEARVEGVMLAMGRRVLLVGDFVDRVLTLKGERPEDGAGYSHGSESEAKAGPIVATMQADGTLVGEMSTNRGRSKWKGERLKPR